MNIKKLDVNLINNSNDTIDAIVYTNNLNLNLNDIEVIRRYPIISAIAVRGKLDNIKQLSKLTTVSYICSVSKIYSFANENNNFSKKDKNLENSNKIYNYTKQPYNYLKNIFNISSNRLAILDTGVSNHIDLSFIKNRIIKNIDYKNDLTYNYDDNGHGTFVAGVAVGNGIMSGLKVQGVSPNSEVISIKIMDSTGESDVFNALDGMQWIVDNYKRYNIRVVCMSFGAIPIENDPLLNAVKTMYKLGIIVVCASGNSGKNSYMSPAVSPYVISVGSVDKNNNISSFCSYGVYNNRLYPFIFACGEDVVGISNKNGYSSMSGTSVSCPIVCGYILKLIEKYPNINAFNVKNALKNNCKYINNLLIVDYKPYNFD